MGFHPVAVSQYKPQENITTFNILCSNETPSRKQNNRENTNVDRAYLQMKTYQLMYVQYIQGLCQSRLSTDDYALFLEASATVAV
jgi:hypothetical protein